MGCLYFLLLFLYLNYIFNLIYIKICYSAVILIVIANSNSGFLFYLNKLYYYYFILYIASKNPLNKILYCLF